MASDIVHPRSAKSAAVPTVNFDPIRERLDDQITRIFQARAIVQSVRAVLDDEDEGCDSWYALDVVQETLKEIAAQIDEARGALASERGAGAH
jgi:hypothetical protein